MIDESIHPVTTEKSREQQESMNEYISNFVSSLTEDQCKAGLRLLKPIAECMETSSTMDEKEKDDRLLDVVKSFAVGEAGLAAEFANVLNDANGFNDSNRMVGNHV